MKTCLVCKVEVSDLLQHVKTEWHTYNLRRGTVGLNSILETEFKAKQNELLLKSIKEAPKQHFCCNKVYKSDKTYENHLKSKKHTEVSPQSDKNFEENEVEEIEVEDEMNGMIVEYVEDSETESSEEETEATILTPLTTLDCLFCKSSSNSLETNLLHMSKKHNFHLPYADFVSNTEGLIEYLVCLVDEYHVCLQCNKQFDDRNGVRSHMKDSNHMRLYFHLESNGDDLSDFYCDLPKQAPSLDDPEDDMQIEAVLPSGKKIGHRNMKVYFNQNLNGLSNVNQLAITSGSEKAQMSLIRSGQYGSLTTQQTREVVKAEKKYKKLEAKYIQLRQSRFSNFQAHFRAQILM